MTSRQEIEIALAIKVVERRVQQLSAAHAQRDVPAMQVFACQLEAKAKDVCERLSRLADSPVHMNGGEDDDLVEGTAL